MIYKLMEAAEGKCTKLAGVYLVALVRAGAGCIQVPDLRSWVSLPVPTGPPWGVTDGAVLMSLSV